MRFLTVILFVLALAPPLAAARENRALAQILADYEAFDRFENPINAGQAGDRAALARLPDVTPEADARRLAANRAFAERLARLEGARLTPEEALNRRLLARQVGLDIEEAQFDLARIPFENDSGFFSLMGYLSEVASVRTREDAEAYVARLEAAPKFYRDNLANMRRGLASGFIASRPTVELVIAIQKRQDMGALLKPLAKAPSDAALKARADAAIAALRIVQAEALMMFEKEYLPKTPALRGARGQPNGEAWYRYAARRNTTTDMTPEDIHALGLSEVARIRGRMEAIIKEVGFKGTFAEFLAFLRTDPQFYAKTPDELMMRARDLSKRADDAMPTLFWTLPRLSYGVRPVPDDLAPSYTTGRYLRGSEEQGQPGVYYVNTYNLSARPLYELPALTLHEAVPGHHHQIALAQEQGALPWFRRQGFVTAYVEGWGLYAEFLGEEIGFYRTPYERFGRLSYEMWRACRLVADTGIHWLGWTLDEARKCFAENSALAPHNIETELQRYLSWPGQALAYKIGELELIRLRREAEAALGDRFDRRRFHDAILLEGALPLDVLNERVDAWIAATKAGRAP